ncbi:beta-lactamase family protein [Thiotrichales bacterium 19S3-7]|nr:beta-lactamase family protein [Thiotrichales bacterium 19S3-7]MCF6802417.1 beta-lactamase family protein [Thiotrichales bacterium 19S3-11]
MCENDRVSLFNLTRSIASKKMIAYKLISIIFICSFLISPSYAEIVDSTNQVDKTKSVSNCKLLISGDPLSKFCQQQFKNITAQVAGLFPESNSKIITGQRLGGVFAVYQNNKKCYISCGYRDLNFKERLHAHSVFEIASNTKTFTAAILGTMHVQKKLNVLHTVQDNLPSGFNLGTDEINVTYQQLATFSGGFPYSDPPNAVNPGIKTFPQSSFEADVNSLDPSQLPSVSAYNVNPPQYLPTMNVYSNSSFGLLGQILANIEYPGVAFDDSLLNALYCQYILNPLKMYESNTCMPSQAQNGNCLSYNDVCVAQSKWQKLDYVPGFRIDNSSETFISAAFFPYQPWAPAGAMRSSPSDMLKYMQMILGVNSKTPTLTEGANLGLNSNNYLPVPEGEKPRINHPAPNSPSHQGWAWVVLPANANHNPNTIQFKLGGHVGFNSFIGVDKSLGYALVILTNTGPDKSGKANPNPNSNLQTLGVNIMIEASSGQ